VEEWGSDPALTTAQRDSRAAQLDGRRVLMRVGEHEDEERQLGVIRFCGRDRRPHYYDVEFEDGRVRTRVTHTMLTRHAELVKEAQAQQRVGAGGVVITPALGQPSSEPMIESPVLPWSIELSNNPSAVLGMLLAFMLGEWPRQHAEKISRFVHGGSSERGAQQGSWPDSTVTEAEVACLMDVLDLRGVFGVVDLWAHGSGVRDAFARKSLPVVTNNTCGGDHCDFQLDALQLRSYLKLQEAGVCLDVVISAPWLVLLDLALPMAVVCAKSLVCMRVPPSYVSEALLPRKMWLTALQERGRLVKLQGVPLAPSGRQYEWLLVFKDEWTKRRMLKVEVSRSAMGEELILCKDVAAHLVED
jgi:hypothetical protein